MKYWVFCSWCWGLLLCASGLWAQVTSPKVLFSLERTTCYGQCPYYNVEIYDDGTARYHGKQYVERLGVYTAIVPDSVVHQLRIRTQVIDYQNFYPKYPKRGLGIIDLPMCISSVEMGGVLKTIYNRNEAPVALIEYERLFDDLVEDLNWRPMQ